MIVGAFLFVCVSAALGRDAARLIKTVPAVSNSLVNLGKMDIAFYINGKRQDMKPDHAGPFLSSTSAAAEEPCPCSSLKYFKDSSRSHPSEILSELLRSNDLFSYREPSVSTRCCDSHEQVQEDSIIFEFGPKQRQVGASPLQASHLPSPLLLDGLLSGRSTHSLMPLKQKLIELFIYPKKGELTLDLGNTIKNSNINKDIIKVVGDKEIRNDFKTMKLLPPQPQSPPSSSSSVKKDLTVQQSNNKQDDNKQDEMKPNLNTNLI